MTPAEIDALPAGRELDALVAERVMGWRRMTWREYSASGRAALQLDRETRETLTYSWHDTSGAMTENAEDMDDYDSGPDPVWSPSTDIEAAWQVVEKLDDDQTEAFLENLHGAYIEALFYQSAADAALAICHAALKVVGAHA